MQLYCKQDRHKKAKVTRRHKFNTRALFYLVFKTQLRNKNIRKHCLKQQHIVGTCHFRGEIFFHNWTTKTCPEVEISRSILFLTSLKLRKTEITLQIAIRLLCQMVKFRLIIALLEKKKSITSWAGKCFSVCLQSFHYFYNN